MEQNNIQQAKALHNFYDIITYVNGEFRGIKLSQSKIIEMLKDFGFWVYQLDPKKSIYIHMADNAVKEVSPFDIQRYFQDYIKNLPDCPYTLRIHKKKQQQGIIEQQMTITSDDALNQFLVQKSLFNKTLFNQLIPSQPIELDKDTLNRLKMENNPDDKFRINVNEILAHLSEAGFKKTVDIGSGLTKEADLYFKHVTTNQFMVFTHYNHDKHTRLQGFDYWLCEFKREKDIGKAKPLQVLDSILSFQFHRDWEKIQGLIEKSQ